MGSKSCSFRRIKQMVLIVPKKHFRSDMKYLCRTCKKECDDIPTHMMKVHKFSKSIIDSQLKSNPNTFKNAFEVLSK
ncbi:MAG: hypothetical protein DSN69_07680 [Nitrosopumilus sp. YT1]|nr:MAG: hypothetical protein DSN69_07680 [Nitrosopumilus sp. YT1]